MMVDGRSNGKVKNRIARLRRRPGLQLLRWRRLLRSRIRLLRWTAVQHSRLVARKQRAALWCGAFLWIVASRPQAEGDSKDRPDRDRVPADAEGASFNLAGEGDKSRGRCGPHGNQLQFVMTAMHISELP